MESRKVQRVGSSTLAVSLPTEWVRKVGLKKGDTVFFDQEGDGTLKLMVSKQVIEKKPIMVEVDADLCENPELLRRILSGIYILGYDVIKISSKTRLKREQIEVIRKLTRVLIGIGIMEETRNTVIIECFIDAARFPIHTLLRRLYIIASTMYKEAIDAFSESDISLAEEAVQRRQEANTMFWIIMRLLNTCQKDRSVIRAMKIEDSMQILWYQLTAHFLDLIAEWVDKFARKVIELGENHKRIGASLLNEILELSKSSYGICHKAITSFFSSDINLANEAIETYSRIQKEEEELQRKICAHAYLHKKSFPVSKYFKGEEPIDPCMIAQISFIIWSVRRISELGSEIAEVAINKTLCKNTRLCRELLG